MSFASSAYMRTLRLICRKLFKQVVRLALLFAVLRTGNNKAASMAMMAMTSSNSIRVNPLADLKLFFKQVSSIDTNAKGGASPKMRKSKPGADLSRQSSGYGPGLAPVHGGTPRPGRAIPARQGNRPANNQLVPVGWPNPERAHPARRATTLLPVAKGSS